MIHLVLRFASIYFTTVEQLGSSLYRLEAPCHALRPIDLVSHIIKPGFPQEAGPLIAMEPATGIEPATN